jgi:DNA-binding MarR family transcriptional regulator
MGDAEAEAFSLLAADVFELAGALRRHGEHLAGRVGQTQARWQLLSVVSDDGRTVPQAARRLGVSRQAVQRLADELDADGLVRYVANPHHRRSRLLQLTPSGRQTLEGITAAARDWQATVTRELESATIEQTRRNVRSILQRIAATDDTNSA